MSNQNFRKFSSYNGLDRTAQLWGLPVMVVIIGGTIAVFISFIAQIFFGVIGFAFIFAPISIFAFIKMETATDDKALRMIKLHQKYKIHRHLYKEFGNTLTYHPIRYLHKTTDSVELIKKQILKKL